ncbi:hypothetical protein D8M03_16915 [Lysinibacillus endophyticus]|uniref:Uncharacterized protein n=1 Tax=Ureibacillus endophyticus TaxID=1978490 RepID=A0A494YS40_9BACL|nr:hypothetical protein D8M03_16915 [Lysinibacillus endophyticus]
MNEKRKGKFQIFLIFLIMLLIVSAFVLLFLGHYKVTFVLFGILMLLMSFISNWTGTDTEVYLYKKIHKNNKRW